jgi:hypothetical protein
MQVTMPNKTFTATELLEHCAKAQEMNMDDFISALLVSLMNVEFN